MIDQVVVLVTLGELKNEERAHENAFRGRFLLKDENAFRGYLKMIWSRMCTTYLTAPPREGTNNKICISQLAAA